MFERLTVTFSQPNGASGVPCGWHKERKVVPWTDGHPQPQLGETWLVEVLTQWDGGVIEDGYRHSPDRHFGACFYVRPLKLVKAGHG